MANGCSQQLFSDGEVELSARLGDAYVNTDAGALIGGQCQARYTEPLGTRRMTSDHSPMEVRVSPPSPASQAHHSSLGRRTHSPPLRC